MKHVLERLISNFEVSSQVIGFNHYFYLNFIFAFVGKTYRLQNDDNFISFFEIIPKYSIYQGKH